MSNGWLLAPLKLQGQAMLTRKFVVFSVALALAFTVMTFTPAQNPTASFDVQIRELMTQKRDVLKERLEGAQRLHEVGGIRMDRVLIARIDLLGAEFDLAASKAERIAVLESQLKARQEGEHWVTRRYKDGSDSFEAKLIATADRLEAEIALWREKAKP